MHGGAVTLARQFLVNSEQWTVNSEKPSLIMADDMLDVTTFLSLTRRLTHDIPFVLYMHENQLTYPLPLDPLTGAMRRNHNERDHHYVFINYSSMLAADQIIFNSHFHLESWFDELPRYLRHYPENREIGNVERLREKSTVLPVGITPPLPSSATPSSPPLILWNQRWEYDKNPEAFFKALYQLDARGVDFWVAICGENFSRQPQVFDEAAERLKSKVVHFGFAEREKYTSLLHEADIVVSTAVHEFFGISIVEAVAHGAYPILPNRLSYPELFPKRFRAKVLYESEEALIELLENALIRIEETRQVGREMMISAEIYHWPNVAPRYDTLLENLVDQSTK